MNRREALRTLAAGGATGALAAGALVATVPAEATVADPLLALITAYRAGIDAFNEAVPGLASPVDTAWDALALATWQTPYVAMRDAPPSPTTMRGAIEGIRAVIEEEESQGNFDDITPNMLRAILVYLEGRA